MMNVYLSSWYVNSTLTNKISDNGTKLVFKGYGFYNKKLISSIELKSILEISKKRVNKQEFLKDFITNLNGSFTLVVHSSKWLFACVDRLRSYPLFYANTGTELYISDNYNWILNMLPKKTLNKSGIIDYFLTGYVTGDESLYSEIQQIQAGEYIFVTCEQEVKVKRERYYKFIHNDFYDSKNVNPDEIFKKMLNNVFKRLIKSLDGKKAVIPLSGGLDSRLIATMLKEFNYKDVICFSYGKPGNTESKISKQIANKLGFKWLFVPYSRDKWYHWYHSKELKEYYYYSNLYVSLPHIQDWPAVWELKKQFLIPENSVFIPGHTGDFISGGHIPLSWIEKSNNTFLMKDVIMKILEKHYCLFNYPKNSNIIPKLINRISRFLQNFQVNNNEDAASAFEYWEWQERQAKFIVNSVRVYEFWGYDWRIPLWDNEMMDFFSHLPIELRMKQYFYKLFLIKSFPKLFPVEDRSLKYLGSNIVFNQLRKLKHLIDKDPFLGKRLANIYIDINHTYRIYFTDYYMNMYAWYGINSYIEHLRKIRINKFVATSINSFLVDDIIQEIIGRNLINVKKMVK